MSVPTESQFVGIGAPGVTVNVPVCSQLLGAGGLDSGVGVTVSVVAAAGSSDVSVMVPTCIQNSGFGAHVESGEQSSRYVTTMVWVVCLATVLANNFLEIDLGKG
jgi:hypothetical protein